MTKADHVTDKDELASYYAQGRAWAFDRENASRRSRSTAWTIAIIAVGVAALEAIALAMLAPLKTIEHHTILVDRQTGYTQVLNGDGVDRITADQALTQSLLAQYVVARESFDIATVAADYRKVALWSADRARSTYVASMQAANPESPFATLPRTSILATHIRSVSKLGPEIALIRFETERLDRGQAHEPGQSWAAVIHYRFVAAPMSLDDRLVNPLGFQVTRYRRDQEAPPIYDTSRSDAASATQRGILRPGEAVAGLSESSSGPSVAQ
jgi:type IV secretion system protein VirB8